MKESIDVYAGFQRLLEDNRSGSSAILQQVLDLVQECLSSPDVTLDRLKNELSALGTSFPFFAVLNHFLNEAAMADRPEFMASLVERYKREWEDVNEKMAYLFLSNVDLDNQTILLHSQSGAVITLFRILREEGKTCRIIQMESRPAGEGIQQAEKLAAMGFKPVVIADAAFTRYLQKIDMAIVGADTVCSREFINKIGTHAIAMAAFLQGFPLHLLADSRKFVSGDCDKTEEKGKPAGEIVGSSRKRDAPILVENYYFETTPLKYVATVCTESSFRRL